MDVLLSLRDKENGVDEEFEVLILVLMDVLFSHFPERVRRKQYKSVLILVLMDVLLSHDVIDGYNAMQHAS